MVTSTPSAVVETASGEKQEQTTDGVEELIQTETGIATGK